MKQLDEPHSGTEAAGSSAAPSPAQDRHDTNRDVGRNLGAFAVGHFVVRILGLGVLVVVTRLLTTADFGRYSVAVALSSMLTVVVESGMGGYLVREGTQSPHRAAVALGHVVMLQLGTGTIAVGGCALIGTLLHYDRETLLATIFLAVSSVALIAQRSFLAILSALNQSRTFAAFLSGQAVVTAVATIGAAVAGAGPDGIAAAVMVASLLGFPSAHVLLHRHWDEKMRFERSGLWETLTVAAAYSATKLGVALLTYIDAVMVQAFKGNVAAAQYGASYRLMMAVRMFQQIYSDGLAQPAARLAKQNRAELEELLNRAMCQLYVVGLAVGVGGLLLSERIMTAVFGAPYAPAATASALLFATIPMSFACQPCIIVALAMGLEKQVAKTFAATVAVNVAANVVLIPAYGPAGAAATMIVSSLVLYGIATRLLVRQGIHFALGVRVLKISVAGALMAVVVVAAGALPLAAVIALGAVVYAAALRALRALDAVDLTMMPMGPRFRWLAAP